MRIAEMIGTVTLNRCLPSYQGASLKLVAPLSLDNLLDGGESAADTIVVWDELGAGSDSRIAMSEGAEAAQPFRPQIKPVDAYNAAILDEVRIQIGE